MMVKVGRVVMVRLGSCDGEGGRIVMVKIG